MLKILLSEANDRYNSDITALTESLKSSTNREKKLQELNAEAYELLIFNGIDKL